MMLTHQSDEIGELYPGPWFAIPRDMLDEAQELGFNTGTVLTFNENERRVLYEVRQALIEDPALEHLSTKDIEDILQAFSWRLTLALRRQRSGVVRTEIVNQLIEELEAPIRPYSVLYEIEHLSVSKDGLDFGPVRILAATQDDLDEWQFSKFAIPTPPKVGSTIAICRVEAGSPAVADKRAGALVDQALDTMRISVVQFGYRIWDNQMRFGRNPWYYASEGRDTGVTSASKSYRQEPLTLELTAGGLSEFSSQVLDLLSMIWDKRTPDGLRNSLVRSIRWMGKSITAFSTDDKVTALCTALECLLSDRSAGLKSVDLCRRSMVLGELSDEGFVHPSKLMHLYDSRSSVVHGSAFGVCDEGDYRILLNMAIDVLRQVILAVRDNPRITTKQKLFVILDDPKHLKPCLEWCLEVDPRGLRPLIDDIRERIDEVNDAQEGLHTGLA